MTVHSVDHCQSYWIHGTSSMSHNGSTRRSDPRMFRSTSSRTRRLRKTISCSRRNGFRAIEVISSDVPSATVFRRIRRAHLPDDVSCSRCVLQWRYHAGNSWGTDHETGRSCLGCGLQEEFYKLFALLDWERRNLIRLILVVQTLVFLHTRSS
jgi:hypothetical protein